MLDDRQLLSQYVAEGSDAAFGELVARYVNLVHSAALRRTGGNAELAKEAAQLAFTDLARKARWLPTTVVLAGWLHQATRFAAAHLVRAEQRRTAREQEALLMNSLESGSAPDWDQMRPLLDAALDRLAHTDRDALLLRFFEQRSLAEVGDKLGLNEDAARKRIGRALDKLRADLVRKGLTTSAAALSAALAANAVQVAPAGLAGVLATVSLTSAVAGAGTSFTLLKLMAMTNVKFGLVTALVVAGVATPLVVQHRAGMRLHEQNLELQRQRDQLEQIAAQNFQYSNLLAQTRSGQALAADQSSELLRLRGEVGRLRRQTNELARLEQENRRLRSTDAQARPTTETPPHPPEYFEQLHQMAAGKESDLRSLGLVFRLYANEHGDQFPTNLEQIDPYLRSQKISLTGTNEVELFYQGSLNQLSNVDPGNVIVFRDREVWVGPDGKSTRVYGMADGSVQTVEADDNFQSWEASRTFPRAAGGR